MPLIVHFKRPSDWRNTVNIHYWDTTPAVPQTTWPGVAMTAEGDDWFIHRFETAETASVVFNDGAGRQSGNLRRDQEGWYYRNNQWYDTNPERPQIPVVTAYFHRHRQGKGLVHPDKSLGEAANFLFMINGHKPKAPAAAMSLIARLAR